MKKLVRTSLNNVANKRGVRDLNIQLYSHDKNNAGFEFVIKNEVDLSEYKAKVLFDFQETFATWETKGIVEGNVVKVKFDTTFITKCEEVIGYLFLDSETNSLDVFKFKFNVVLSEIDKYDTAKRGFRYIKDQEVVDVITRSELEEEIKKLQVNGGIDLSNYLTTSVANEIFATKQELPSVSELVTTKQLTTAKNSVVEEISNKGYVTSTVAEETYVKKSDLPTPYNDSALVERITLLENRPSTGGNVDTTNFVTIGEFEEERKYFRHPLYTVYETESLKEYLDDIPNLFGKPLNIAYSSGEIFAKMDGNNFPRNVQIFKGDPENSKFVDFDASMYSLANSLPDGYNLSSVRNDINNKVIFLSNKNFSEVVPRDELKAIVKEVLTELKSENN